MIIAFSGPDGTGKTTLARLLARYLTMKNVKTHYIRFKAHHMGMFLLLLFLRLLGVVPPTSSPRVIDYHMRRLFAKSRLFLLLELVNSIIWLLLNVKFKTRLSGKHVIVAERYIPDFIVSMLLIRPSTKILRLYLKALSPFMENTIKVYLIAQPDDIVKRKPDESLTHEYVRILMRGYLIVASFTDIDLLLNTSKISVNGSLKILLTKIRYCYISNGKRAFS
ncbi:MAG: AAA family ATPase [Infirmifilum sp.]